MTARFETLIYTDCRPGQGLLGSAGLQFQARSAGADAEAMALVQRALLYEPPAAWMRERRPVADYPPSFAHIRDGYWATAHGVYLGQEANGTREGNQLTHSLVTDDPDSYGLIRPAQLFGASFWATRPAESAACPPVEAGWQPGPLDAASVQEFVRGHPDCVRLLATLVSTLELVHQPQARRLLFIAEQPEPVLCWLAAATLLLPQRQALEIGFKVFTTNPAYAAQPVLAVHPGWDSSPATVERDLGYVVVDLVDYRWSEVPTSPIATAWAELFSVADPYDVTDAVEVAAASGLEPAAAQQVALATVLGRPLAGEHAAAAVSWLADGPRDLLEAYGEALVDVLAGGAKALPVPALRSLDRITRRGGRYGGRAAPVRLALLTAEVMAAAAEGATSAERVAPLPAPEWDAAHAARARGIVADGLRSAEGVGFDAVLRVARHFDVPVSVDEVQDATAAFVADWMNHPGRCYDPTRWPDGSRFVDLLCDRLTREVQQHPGRAAQIGSQWWRRLLAYAVDPDHPLDAEVLATAMAEGTAAERCRLVEDCLRLTSQPPDTADRVGRFLSTLWSRTPPTMAELDLVCRHTPGGTVLDPAVLDAFVAGERLGPGLTGDAIEVCRRCRDRLLVQPGPEVARLLDDDDRVLTFCQGLPNRAEALDDLAGISAEVLTVRGGDLAAALHGAGRGTALRVLPALPVEVVETYTAGVAATLHGKPAAADLAYAYCILESCRKSRRGWPATVSKVLSEPLVRWVRGAPDKAVDQVADQVRALGGHEGWIDWQAWCLRERGNRRRRRWRR